VTWKARPTWYAGVLMRSRLEASFAQWLDHRKWNWEYEPFCFAGPRGQYLPDFRILFDDQPGTGIYVEVKPTPAMAWEARHSMMPIRETYPAARLAVVSQMNSGFGCFGSLQVGEWHNTGWPDLPDRIPGSCRCGASWIDPEFKMCVPCWKTTCMVCGVLLNPDGEGPDICETCAATAGVRQ
jgi:hypothetical protein